MVKLSKAYNRAVWYDRMAPFEIVRDNLCLPDSRSASLISCSCNPNCGAIREGFVDKATGVSKLLGNLADGASL
jgi:hypothetical protein